jgi:carbon-monoxide dehydrogenase medium subunit
VRAFDFLQAKSAAEASATLAQHGEGARALAGGTSLVLLLRQRLAEPTHVVHIGNLPELRGVRIDGDGALHIGALTTHAEVASNPLILERFPVIAEMAAQVANPQVRNVATLGGNLCHADPASDPPTCLVALGARVRVLRGKEMRDVELEGFFKGYYETALEPGELLTEVVVPALPKGGTAHYSRFITNPAEGRPLAAVALRAIRDRDKWADVRLVLGAVVAAPTRMPLAERFLTEHRITKEVLAEAADLAANAIDPIDDFRASASYRRDATRVITRRLLERAHAN